MTAHVTFTVVCGFEDCDQQFDVDPDDPMAAHEAYLEHLADHDPVEPDCETPDQPYDLDAALDKLRTRMQFVGRLQHAEDFPDGTSVTIDLGVDLDADHHRADPQFDDMCSAAHRSADCYVLEHREQARIDRFMAGGNDA